MVQPVRVVPPLAQAHGEGPFSISRNRRTSGFGGSPEQGGGGSSGRRERGVLGGGIGSSEPGAGKSKMR